MVCHDATITMLKSFDYNYDCTVIIIDYNYNVIVIDFNYTIMIVIHDCNQPHDSHSCVHIHCGFSSCFRKKMTCHMKKRFLEIHTISNVG